MQSMPDALSSLLDSVSQRTAAQERASKAAETAGISYSVSNSWPRALVLVVTNLTCDNCGTIHRQPNACLVRYDAEGFSNSIHYRQIDLKPFLTLPRELKVHERTIPFCERCFING
jgi:hypothetical protein